MKTTVERTDTVFSQNTPHMGAYKGPPSRFSREQLLPFAIFFAMVGAVLFMDAVLPLRDLWFHEAQLTQLGTWPVLPSLILFPGWTLIPPVPFLHASGTPDVLVSWAKLPLLFSAFLLVFIIYIVALYRLPQRISTRYIFRTTALLGLLYMLISVVTSPDLYSYIAYARMGIMHGLNPITTIPTAIRSDEIYHFVLWVDQPSAYGPTWAIITCLLQWLIVLFGSSYILPMVIALRMLGLLTHLLSTLLVWSISGYLQQLNGAGSSLARQKRIRATLAFAWNPLLLLEACTNAHNDSTLLVFILLAIWILVREQSKRYAPIVERAEAQTRFIPGKIWRVNLKAVIPVIGNSIINFHYQDRPSQPVILSAAKDRAGRMMSVWRRTHSPAHRSFAALRMTEKAFPNLIVKVQHTIWQRVPEYLRVPIITSVLFAVATCLKMNIAILLPGLLLYFWHRDQEQTLQQKLRVALAIIGSYAGIVVLLYAPFWQDGAIFNVFKVNPATYRTINTVADTMGHLANSVGALMGFPPGAPIGSPAERFAHTFSMGIFAILYTLLLWRAFRFPQRIATLNGLLRWMAIAWLLYCAVGSPWFWPWYMVTFFGLFALIEASSSVKETGEPSAHTYDWPRPEDLTCARLLVFSMLSLYCFITWGPAHTFVPGLPGFLWSYFNGLWVWLLPSGATVLLARETRWLRFLTRL